MRDYDKLSTAIVDPEVVEKVMEDKQFKPILHFINDGDQDALSLHILDCSDTELGMIYVTIDDLIRIAASAGITLKQEV